MADIYMKVESVPGNATAVGYEDWIQIQSFQFGVSQNVATPQGGGQNRDAGTASISDVSISKVGDKSDPELLKAMFSGQGKKVEFDFVQRYGETLLAIEKYVLTDVLGAHYGTSGGAGESQSSFGLNFATMEKSYIPRATDGSEGSPTRVTMDVPQAKIS